MAQIYNGTVKKNETMVTVGKWTGLDIREIRQLLHTRGHLQEEEVGRVMERIQSKAERRLTE